MNILIIYLLIGVIYGFINAYMLLTNPLVALDNMFNILHIQLLFNVEYETGLKLYAALTVVIMTIFWPLAILLGIFGLIRNNHD